MQPRSRLFQIGDREPRRAPARSQAPSPSLTLGLNPGPPSRESLFEELRRDCLLRHGVAHRRAAGPTDPWGR